MTAASSVIGMRVGAACHPATWLARMGGARTEVLVAAPSGRARYVAMGGVILTTAGLAAVSATFALQMALHLPVWLAAVFGFGWGCVILNLDRMLVLGMGHERSWKKNLAMALPRVFLAVVLGTVISTPLTLQIFNREIAAQMAILQQTREEAFEKQLDGMTAQIAQLTKHQDADQAILDAGGVVDPSKDPRVTAANATLASKQLAYNGQEALYQNLASQAQGEFNGTTGTGIAGDGPQYEALKSRADQQQQVAEAAYTDLTAAQQALTTAQTQAALTAKEGTARRVQDTKTDLKTTSGQVALLTKRKVVLQSSFQSLNANDTGILSRLEALDALASQRPVMRTAQYLLALLFICVEVLPVMMKFLVNLGSETAYDRVAARMETRETDDYETEANAIALAAKIRAELVVEDEKDRVGRQKAVLAKINEEVTARQQEVVTEALRLWSEHARTQSQQALDEYELGLSTHPAPPISPLPPISPGTKPVYGQAPTIATTYGIGAPTPPVPADTEYVTSMDLPADDTDSSA